MLIFRRTKSTASGIVTLFRWLFRTQVTRWHGHSALLFTVLLKLLGGANTSKVLSATPKDCTVPFTAHSAPLPTATKLGKLGFTFIFGCVAGTETRYRLCGKCSSCSPPYFRTLNVPSRRQTCMQTPCFWLSLTLTCVKIVCVMFSWSPVVLCLPASYLSFKIPIAHVSADLSGSDYTVTARYWVFIGPVLRSSR